MASNTVVINDLIKFNMDDITMERFLEILYSQASLVMDCKQCGTTIIPQCRREYSQTLKNEFKISCVKCGRTHTVRMYGSARGHSYGFILPTDDSLYKSALDVGLMQ